MTIPLAEIKRLMELADHIPWHYSGDCEIASDRAPFSIAYADRSALRCEQNAELIVACVNAMPAIIERMEKLEKVAEAALILRDGTTPRIAREMNLWEALAALDKWAGK